MVNSEKWKTDLIQKVTDEFVSLQTALKLSAKDHSKPARPSIPEPRKRSPDPTNSPRKRGETRGNKVGNFSKSLTEHKHHTNDDSMRNLSSSFRNLGFNGSATRSLDDDDGAPGDSATMVKSDFYKIKLFYLCHTNTAYHF